MTSSRWGAVVVVLAVVTVASHGQDSTTEASTISDVTTTTSSVGPTCASHTCRMLCPYGFETDKEGCVLCECKNPCKGVECPGGTECQVDESGCTAGEPCVPLTNCRKARAPLGECAYGEPLTGANQRPLLCGSDKEKPNCPVGYECFVQQNAEYGLCCPQEQQTRASECPQSVSADFRCDTKCEFDSDCDVGLKCCETSCGKSCLSSRNSTTCEQQRRLARLFSEGVDAPGYIPQCDKDGQFQPKQCSTNGKVCWCVNPAGQQVTGSMGPASNVSCAVKDRSSHARSQKIEETHACPLIMCDVLCEYGYKKNDEGCHQCECIDPCENKTCSKDEECVIVKEEPCQGLSCSVTATCTKKVRSGHVCASGEAQLRDNATVNCADAELCAEGFDCEILPGESMGICCKTIAESEAVDPQTKEVPAAKEKISTMCEYLRDLSAQGEQLALPAPVCNEIGRYAAVQCDNHGCFCVDDFGVEIRNSRKENKTANEVECRQMRSAKPCYNLLCRLGCDYGFEYDEEGCPVCACRNPCKYANCTSDEICQLAEPTTPCTNRWCPPVPKCINKEIVHMNLNLLCPGSSEGPLMNSETNEVIQCYSDSREDSCPRSYSCLPASEDADYGFCCPVAETREIEEDLSESQTSPDVKPGQCPYLIPLATPIAAMSCEFKCDGDKSCANNHKCCSNGCGTQCMGPVQMTGCEHSRTISEHQLHAGQRIGVVPSCDPIRRTFEDVQCHREFCWCADEAGIEIPATRVRGPPQANCTAARVQGQNINSTICNIECNVQCEFGQELDAEGCPRSCECIDPCEKLDCGLQEECRLVKLSCVGNGPCPRQALCRPKVENVCPLGEPLLVNETLITCGPGEDVCPTSHKCQLDIFGEFAQCCPKPREICFSPPPLCLITSHAPEKIFVEERWFFNAMERQCQSIQHNKDFCHNGLNFFSSKNECESTCPVYTECEMMREKARNQLRNSANVKPTYLPKCNSRLGVWEPVQCLYDLGLCWCVDQKGNQIPGSMVRGTPNCSIRTGRSLTGASICPSGEPVHICDADEVCGEKVCAAQTNATCRVDPCGGCKAVFYNEMNQEVDCNKGLTACHEEAQMVVNSRAWTNQGLNTISNLVSAIRDLSEGFQDEMSEPSNAIFSSPMEMLARQASSFLPSSHQLMQVMRHSSGFMEGSEERHRSKRETPSDEISDYDDPAARAMSAFHQNRRRQNVEPIAEISAPPKVVVPLRSPIIMIVHRRIQHAPPNPLELLQSLNLPAPRMRVMVQIPTDIKEEGEASQEKTAMNDDQMDPALFMSQITHMMDKVMGGQLSAGSSNFPQRVPPQSQESERVMVVPNFAEVRMTLKSDGPVPMAAMRQVEQGSLNHLLKYLFGHQDPRESKQVVEKTVVPLSDQVGCPQGGFAETIRSMVGGCRNECNRHADCSSNEKCCFYGCSSTCVAPVLNENNGPKVKPGNCPAVSMFSSSCLLPSVQCMEDAHCPDNQKCCKGPCGAACKDPADETPEASMPQTMVLAPPVCSPDGGYAVSQSQGSLSWCVDRYGAPIDATLTKGNVACDVNGTMTKRDSLGDVCPDGKVAKVCRKECMSATCFAHPDAMCVADPCNDCEIHFVDAADKIDCNAVCEQDSFKTSSCSKNSGIRTRTRYTFNQTSQMCEKFEFECNGNDNNFETTQECEQKCKKPKSICELPKERGLCRARFRKWWFNPVTQQCEEFHYGGCGGNANNFETKSMCEMVCPDMVICPYDTVTKEGLTREPCDRVAACTASSCPGDRNAVCNVDPCDCRATWINPDSGEAANCESTEDENLVSMAKEIQPKCVTMQMKNAVTKNPYVPECDSEGNFVSTQCVSSGLKKECWCVDSAGHQIGEPFRDGSKTCDSVKITRVEMDVAFASVSDQQETLTADASEKVKRMLRSIDSKVNEVSTELNPEDKMVHAKFSLAGSDCATVAYKIEQLIIAKALRAGDQVAEYKLSKFTYVANDGESIKTQGSRPVEVIYSADKNEVLAVKRLLEPRTVDARTTTMAAAFLAVTVVMCILLLLTVLMHRNQAALKKQALDGSEPGAISFQNPVYILWTNRVMSAVCRRSPIPSPPKSPDDLAQMESQNEAGIDDHDDVDDEFNNPNYDEVIDERNVNNKVCFDDRTFRR